MRRSTERRELDRGRQRGLRHQNPVVAFIAKAVVARAISTVSAMALGALAVVGLVVAFSLSSTLVKRADSPASWSRSGG